MRPILALVLLTACQKDDTAALASLDGTWAGQVHPDGADYEVQADFAWDPDQELLTGKVTVGEPAGPHAYAVRRWEDALGDTDLHLTDLADATRGLQMVGSVGQTFSGTMTLRYTCPEGTCGYQGAYDLVPAAPLGTTSGGTGR